MINIEEKLILESKQPAHCLVNREIYKKYKQYFKSVSEMLYYYKNPEKAEKEKYCKTCGKPNRYININLGYSQYCGSKCANSNPNKKQKIKDVLIKKYGVDNVAHLQWIKDKKRNTCLKKYGVTHYAKTQEYMEKTKKVNLKKYGSEYYVKTKSFQEKRKSTCLRKYKVDNISKTKYFKDFLKEHQKEIQGKRYLTMKEHNSFNKSSSEETIYQELLKKFSKEDIIRQYKSKEYPFRCDFYIPSKNLYMEYNGSWVHGFENNKKLGAFDKNNQEHIDILNRWKGKNSIYYKHAIKVWTILDPLKLKTFKENNLNYEIFYTLEEFNKWYNNI